MVWLSTKAFYILAAVSVIFLLLLIRESRRLYDAALIWDNRIISVPSALISTTGGETQKDAEETVVSTFGILIGNKIYRWGLEGIYGTRLHAAKIDTERMYLTFGDKNRTMRVELLHGMTDRQTVTETARKLLYETGVTTEIDGWE